VTSKPRVNDYLLFVFRPRELDEEDFRGKVVDVRDSKSHERIRQLVGDDLVPVNFQLKIDREGKVYLDVERGESLLHLVLLKHKVVSRWDVLGSGASRDDVFVNIFGCMIFRATPVNPSSPHQPHSKTQCIVVLQHGNGLLATDVWMQLALYWR
jgi:hypothetical protein